MNDFGGSKASATPEADHGAAARAIEQAARDLVRSFDTLVRDVDAGVALLSDSTLEHLQQYHSVAEGLLAASQDAQDSSEALLRTADVTFCQLDELVGKERDVSALLKAVVQLERHVDRALPRPH